MGRAYDELTDLIEAFSALEGRRMPMRANIYLDAAERLVRDARGELDPEEIDDDD